MAAGREKFPSQAAPDLLVAMREIARKDGRHFHAVLEDAMRDYIEGRAQGKTRPGTMSHFCDSLEKNRRLGELLAES